MSTFLAAKRSVDDRALDRRVWDRFEREVCERGASGPVRILDAGAGVGAMAVRLAERVSCDIPLVYRGFDTDATVVAAGRRLVPGWLTEAGYDVEERGGTCIATPRSATSTGIGRLELNLEVTDLRAIEDRADAIVAAAFMDIVEPRATLATLRSLVRPDGLVYMPLTFDGLTSFAPPTAHDREIELLYHRHMDQVREAPGGSRAGSTLLETIPRMGFDLLAAGGADWVVRPRARDYQGHERLVLEHLLETIERALSEFPDETMSPDVIDAWLETRRRQLGRGDLALVVHHLDLLARKSPAKTTERGDIREQQP